MYVLSTLHDVSISPSPSLLEKRSAMRSSGAIAKTQETPTIDNRNGIIHHHSLYVHHFPILTSIRPNKMYITRLKASPSASVYCVEQLHQRSHPNCKTFVNDQVASSNQDLARRILEHNITASFNPSNLSLQFSHKHRNANIF